MSDSTFLFEAANLDGTRQLAAALAQALPDGTTVALVGTLGSGKTRLVQLVAEACGIDPEDVISPTFVLCREYQGRRALQHLDVYRLNDEDQFLELGPDEYFERPALTFIEWADRVESCLPRSHLRIEIEVTGPDARRFTLTATQPELARALAELQRLLS